jgi:type I restriction-modification system DNA methylase subunit
MKTKTIEDYLNTIYQMFSDNDAREESYYPILAQLTNNMYKTHKHKESNIVIMPKKTEAGNPDFVVKDSQRRIIGYIEAKGPLKNLDSEEKKEQITRYREVFPNFILTNFLEFRLYREGKEIMRTTIAAQEFLSSGQNTQQVESPQELTTLFHLFHEYNISPSSDMKWLSKELAKRTRFMRDYVVIKELERETTRAKNDNGQLHGLYKAIKTYLIHDLSEHQFADLYSQTLTYGLFIAATQNHDFRNPENVSRFIPPTNGILRDIFRLIAMGKMPKQLEYCIDDIADLLGMMDFRFKFNGGSNTYTRKDSFIHFYETFLYWYDPQLREKKGIYFTPAPVVSFIVRSIDIILKEKLNKPFGIADRSVKILDPASGTGTFLTEIAHVAMATYVQKFGEGAKKSLIKEHLLENLYGFEEMMAPYAVGHLKMLHTLQGLGIQLSEDERFNLYLTNTLEMDDIEQSDLPGMQSLSRESRLAGKIKKELPITVVLGNPPYAGHSTNSSNNTWIGEQIETYKQIEGIKLGERNPKWLHDDYVKFIRFAQFMIDRNGLGEGVVGMITNHGYLDNPTFRGMRHSLMKSFDEIYIIDLHGNKMKKEKNPDYKPDENVFDIRQGVTIAIFVKRKGDHKSCRVFHSDMWGSRENKYRQLVSHNINTFLWDEITPAPDFYLFSYSNNMDRKKYSKFVKVTDIFPVYSVGIVTARDSLTIRPNWEEMRQTIATFSQLTEPEARRTFNLREDTRDWQVKQAQKDLQDSLQDPEKITPILYRPFDLRYTYYTGRSRGFLCMPRPDIMQHMMRENLGLITVRQVAEGIFNHCFITDTIIESRITTSNKGIGYLFPLYLYTQNYLGSKPGLFCKEVPLKNNFDTQKANISPLLLQIITSKMGFLPTPEQILQYCYAILFSNIYRETYAEGLKIDFPRIPFTCDQYLFKQMAQKGEHLIKLHLMKSDLLNQTQSRFEVEGNNLVKQIEYNPISARLFINKYQYFSNIDKNIWEYKLAGYQVIQKWLKSRRGQKLGAREILHLINIAQTLHCTLKYQTEIDALYPEIEKTLISKSI